MTIYKCSCGEIRDNADGHVCSTVIATFPLPTPSTPAAVGAEIRRLLLSLRAPGHADDGCWQCYATDELRRDALDHAGICWLAPGEMAPQCVCEWSPSDPSGPRLRLAERMEENKALWSALTKDTCMVSRVSSAGCERGTRGCIVRHAMTSREVGGVSDYQGRWLDRVALARSLSCLASNLGIAGALCKSLDLGRDLQHALTVADESAFRSEREKNKREVYRDCFHPGCGRPAP